MFEKITHHRKEKKVDWYVSSANNMFTNVSYVVLASGLKDSKQLLDEVFVLSRIIKVKASVISRGQQCIAGATYKLASQLFFTNL